MSKYDDIINRKYEGSTTRKRMSLANRAAQFAPFAALTGHDAAINETARLTSERVELSADEQRELSLRLSYALEHMAERPELTFVVFQPDRLKAGGRYVQVRGAIKKYDEYERVLRLATGHTLRLDDIVSIDGDMFG